MSSLRINTLLQGGKYRIEKVLGQGGFGITYLASQELLDRKVCIKEFFFKEYCDRDGETSQVTISTQSNHDMVERFMNKFLKEARTISQLDHSNIVKIHDIFKENNTAYYVMDYIEGCSLNDIINLRGALPSDEAVGHIKPIAEALEYLHESNINHLDIKPANIMVRSIDTKAVLIDFGVSKQYDEQGGQTSTTPVGISHGYAPMEQYKQGGVSTFSPQTDIYALGATLYKLVTGQTPPQAMDVLDDGLPSLPSTVSPSVAAAIKKAMQPLKKDRPQSVKEFLDILNNTGTSKQQPSSHSPSRSISNDESTVIVGSTPRPTYNSEPAPKVSAVKEKEKPSYTKYIIGIIAVVLGIIIGVVWTNDKPSEDTTYYEGPAVEVVSVNADRGAINGHQWVDLGLSVKWATCNVGASQPRGYGNYYAWGETTTKSSYTLTHLKIRDDISGNASYDAARANWGGTWRMPTKKEMEELKNKCTWQWTTQSGVNGHKVTGPNGNSIFLPAAGYCGGSSHNDVGKYGYYWSSTPDESNDYIAYRFFFYSGDHNVDWGNRDGGRTVRPVSE